MSDRFTIPYEEDDFASQSKSLGSITTFWDTCGLMGLCPECKASGIKEGCQRHYIIGYIRGVKDNT